MRDRCVTRRTQLRPTCLLTVPVTTARCPSRSGSKGAPGLITPSTNLSSGHHVKFCSGKPAQPTECIIPSHSTLLRPYIDSCSPTLGCSSTQPQISPGPEQHNITFADSQQVALFAAIPRRKHDGIFLGTSSGTASATQPGAMLIQDRASHIPFSKILENGDLVLLLTPVVLPVNGDSGSDPFEALGRGLAKYHPWVRHVPYTVRGGITSTHVGFIRRAKVVIFVISGPVSPGQPSQVELSNSVQVIGENRPHVVVACCNVQDLAATIASCPTILQLPGYSSNDLEVGADLLFLGRSTRPPPPPKSPIHQQILVPHRWSVTEWNQGRDVPDVHELWCQCMPHQFKLHQANLLRVLQRDGYAKHFLVREPSTKEILGFCATYITYLDSKGEILVGSVAALFVRASHRGQGIGRILHDEALRGFKKTRGVTRLQLGSTFPRLLYGIPAGHPSEEWFKRRGWRMDCSGPGTGQVVSDWMLVFDEWPTGGFAPIGVTFRQCKFEDFDRVLETVEQETERNGYMAWYDQYAKLADSMATTDIILGSQGNTIVATAITYVMNSDNPSAEDIPWAGSISEDTGGVTCICITDDLNRNSIMVRLLDACVQALRQQGKNRMYIDAVRGGEAGFQSIGFQKWARYRDIWRNA